MLDEDIIKMLYIDLCEASKNKDLDKLNNILADNYILVHMTGMNQSKKDYINSVKSGELIYYEFEYEDIDIKIDGNKAKVVGKTKTLAAPFGMSKLWWNLRQDLLIEKIDGRWLITNSKASTY